ncbi:hypothetical protein BU646_11225 [Staphylococcus chromogenes]|uniref:hypothetical protein n=1 Tax=Staphylococcus chromogenes TaxID=46126 RepID=UPI000D1B8206|nr:hypothetical protein [Staphylococcus chromogenes]PTG11541.1 hypothetical protein BU646_11225 [Staphylococcus chromogenes]
MIKAKDVIRLKMPHPSINCDLALFAHMYICYEIGRSNKLVKVQTYKPLLEGVVDNFIDTANYLNQHPFKKRSLIDLDKYFFISDIVFSERLKANNNNGIISDNLFNAISNKTNNLSSCNQEFINKNDLLYINPLVRPSSS